jgi:hypothetical protein
VRVRSQTTTNEDDVQTKASPIAAEAALVKRNTDMTKLRMFVGALVNAYSRPVIDAKISENAMSTYLYAPINIYSQKTCKLGKVTHEPL